MPVDTKRCPQAAG
ncbi:hypothetical protein VCCP1050_1689, partial [Vibrio cholerae CP1050(23)]